MMNKSNGKSPFEVVYMKSPNHTLDIMVLPKGKNKAAEICASNAIKVIQEV